MSRESVERGPTGTFFFLPLSLGRTQPLLERALAEWAGRREVATLAYRGSGPTMLPDDGHPVWIVELTGGGRKLALDLSAARRPLVAISHHEEPSLLAAAVFRERECEVKRCADGFAARDAEELAAEALGQIAGPIAVHAGWLRRLLEAHRTNAVLRVVRWNGAPPVATEWPANIAPPEWFESADLETETALVTHALAPRRDLLVARFDAVLAARDAMASLRETDAAMGGVAAAGKRDASRAMEAARLAFVSAVRATTMTSGDRDAIRAAVARTLVAGGVSRKSITSGLLELI